MSKLRIIFMGTPEITIPALESLFESDLVEIVAVVTKPDQPQGRKQIITPPPVKILAEKYNCQIFQPVSLRKDLLVKEKLKDFKPDFLVVFAFGQILDAETLAIPKIAPINIHGSILPTYRGASPIEQSLLNGDKTTGITIMAMNEKMDEGDTYCTHTISISDEDNALSLRQKIAELAKKHLVEDLVKISTGQLKAEVQNHQEATFCKKISKEDGKINFNSQNAKQIVNYWRAFQPWPGIEFEHNNQIFKIHRLKISDEKLQPGQFLVKDKKLFVGTTDQSLIIEEIQQAGKNRQEISNFLLGNQKFFE